jgi:Na+/H+ antiporter NhaD/arsenite permease-like protein
MISACACASSAASHLRCQHCTDAYPAARIPKVYWIGGGTLLMVLLGLVPLPLAGRAAAKGSDVYLFLIGMMLRSELTREQGVFDWLSSVAV